MKKQNKAVGVITAILATLLSILLVPMVFVTAVFGSATSLLKPAGIEAVVQSIDYTEFLEVPQDEPLYIDDVEIPKEVINELLHSPLIEETLLIYVNSVSDVLTGKGAGEGLTAEKFLEIADRHIDYVLELSEEYLPQEMWQDMSKEEMRQQAYAALEQNVDEILKGFPSPQKIANDVVPEQDLEAVQFLLGPVVISVLVGVCVVLALLILVCRLRRFGWMLWIGVDSTIAAVLVALVGFGSKVILSAATQTIGSATAIVQTVAGVMVKQIWLAAGILLAIGVLGIVFGAILRGKAMKKALLAEAAMELPVAEVEAPAVEVAEEAVAEETVAEEAVAEETAE